MQKKLVARTASKKSQKTKMEGKLFSPYILLPLVILLIMINDLRTNKYCFMLSAFYMFLATGYLGKTYLHLFHKKSYEKPTKTSLDVKSHPWPNPAHRNTLDFFFEEALTWRFQNLLSSQAARTPGCSQGGSE